MKIEIKAIDPAAIRYSTCGDWLWLPDGTLQVFVPDYGGRNYNAFLVALHEMVEAWACKRSGITEEQVTEWDVAHPHAEEPAELPDSPYFVEHDLAMAVEKKVCEALGIDWDDHQSWVENAASEVDRSCEFILPKILREGSRYWAELHLFALRHKGSDSSEWLRDWMASLPFEDCPCEAHLKEFLEKNPPDFSRFFEWTIALHNDVNDRIGRSIISVDDARVIWSSKSF